MRLANFRILKLKLILRQSKWPDLRSPFVLVAEPSWYGEHQNSAPHPQAQAHRRHGPQPWLQQDARGDAIVNKHTSARHQLVG